MLKLYNIKDPAIGCVKARYEKLLHTSVKSLKELPPPPGALRAHVRRAVYIAAFYWGKSYLADPQLPPPTEWGWYPDNGKLKMVLTEVPYDKPRFKSLFTFCSCEASSRSCTKCSCALTGYLCYIRCNCRLNCTNDRH